MDEKTKKLKRMAAWTLTIFATIFTVATAVLWLPIYPVSGGALVALGHVFAAAWPILVIDVVLCAGVFYGYRSFLNRQKK